MSTVKSTQATEVAARRVSATAAQVQAQSEALRRKKRQEFMWKSILAHLAVLIFVLFAAFPIYFLLAAAFRPGQALYSTNLQLIPNTITLDNFDHMLNHTPLLTWLKNSLVPSAE